MRRSSTMLRTALQATMVPSRTTFAARAVPAMTRRSWQVRQYSADPAAGSKADSSKEAETQPFSEQTADAQSKGENTESPPTTGSAPDAAAAATPDASATKLATLEKQLAEMKDKYIRQVADYRNLQTRTERDITNAKDFAIQKFAKDLIDSVDNLDRALETVPEAARTDKAANPDLVSLYGGLKMTESILMKTLERHGLKKFTGMGEKFNPNLHEVLYEAPIPDKEAGTIMQVQSTGYTLNGRTIRAAKVGVVKGE